MINKNSNERSSIKRSLVVFSSGTLISRILGLTRDMAISGFFKPWQTDVWIVAFRIPNMLRSILGENAITMSVVPVLSEYAMDNSKEKLQKVVNSIFTIFLFILFIVTTLGIIFSPEITQLLVPEFANSKEKIELTIRLTRIMFPYIFLIGMTALFMGILNTVGHFFVTAVHPIFLNGSLIIFSFFASLFNPQINALAYAVIAGGLLQMLIQTPFMKKLSILPKLTINIQKAELLKVGKLLLPSLISTSIIPIAILINTRFASSAGNGVVSYLFWADRLVQLPLGIFAVSLGTAILPVLSRVSKDKNKLEDNFAYSFRICILILLPATLGLLALSTPIVKVIFQHGRFTWLDTVGTSNALFYLAISLLPSGIIRITIPLYYSMKDSFRPALFSLVGLIINTSICFFTVKNLGIIGIAVAISIASIANSTLLLSYYSYKYGKIRLFSKTFLIKLLVISGLTFFSTSIIASLKDWQKTDLIINDILFLFWAIMSGVLFFLISGYLLNIRKNISN